MNKLLQLIPKTSATTSTGAMSALVTLALALMAMDEMDPNVRGVMVGLCIVAILGVHASGVRSNPDGTDVSEPYAGDKKQPPQQLSNDGK